MAVNELIILRDDIDRDVEHIFQHNSRDNPSVK